MEKVEFLQKRTQTLVPLATFSSHGVAPAWSNPLNDCGPPRKKSPSIGVDLINFLSSKTLPNLPHHCKDIPANSGIFTSTCESLLTLPYLDKLSPISSAVVLIYNPSVGNIELSRWSYAPVYRKIEAKRGPHCSRMKNGVNLVDAKISL